MKPLLSRSITAGLLALGLTAGLATPGSAGLMPQPVLSPSPLSTNAPEIVPVRAEWAGNNNRAETYWPRNRRHWQGDRGRHWQGDRWRHNNWRRHNRDDWRWRRHYPRYYGGSGIYFGLGTLAPSYDYYAPRRTYRVYRGGNAHVRWCYNRYRSYRASDNTFQPYNGPRRQCRSPYR